MRRAKAQLDKSVMELKSQEGEKSKYSVRENHVIGSQIGVYIHGNKDLVRFWWGAFSCGFSRDGDA